MNTNEQAIVDRYKALIHDAREDNDWLTATGIRLEVVSLLNVAQAHWSAAFVAALQTLRDDALAIVAGEER